MSNKTELSIILFSEDGREINFRQLTSGNCFLKPEEMTPTFFWGATGGFEVIVHGNKNIFRGFDFYVAIEAIRFLLHSLYWLKSKTKTFDTDEAFPDAVVSRFQNQTFIKLSKLDDGLLSFSHQPNNEDSDKVNRFFLKEMFSSEDWCEAVKGGLKEYFDVLIPVLHEHQEQEHAKILTKYLVNVWEDVR